MSMLNRENWCRLQFLFEAEIAVPSTHHNDAICVESWRDTNKALGVFNRAHHY